MERWLVRISIIIIYRYLFLAKVDTVILNDDNVITTEATLLIAVIWPYHN
jgi:hypothetical protein